MKKNFVTAVVAFAVTAVAFFGIGCRATHKALVLYDTESGKVYGEFSACDGDEFAVEFVHSVNKSPVRDVFVIRNGEIFADRTVYSAFGAGVQTEIEDGQTLSFDKDGNMVVSGFNIKFDRVKYIVGTVSDHVLYIENKEISLRNLCGRNAHIAFEIRKGWHKI